MANDLELFQKQQRAVLALSALRNYIKNKDGTYLKDTKGQYVLEDENGKLKRLLADAMLDNTALKDLLSKKW